MGYSEAMQAAGAEVLEYEAFGSYQGDWWAKVNFEGRQGWVHGSYGSCSGCDAFAAEFDYSSHEHPGNSYVDYGSKDFNPDACEACKVVKEKLAAFGRGYLDLMTQEEAEKQASENLEWDSDAPGMLKFIKDHPLETVH